MKRQLTKSEQLVKNAAPELFEALKAVMYYKTGIPDKDSSYVANGALTKAMAALTLATQDFDNRHGSPLDRGQADKYYGRPRNPHYYLTRTERIPTERMTDRDILAYNVGYDSSEHEGFKFPPV